VKASMWVSVCCRPRSEKQIFKKTWSIIFLFYGISPQALVCQGRQLAFRLSMQEGTLSSNGAMSMYELTIYRTTIRGNDFSMNGSHLYIVTMLIRIIECSRFGVFCAKLAFFNSILFYKINSINQI